MAEEPIGGMEPTGRRIAAPAADLVELTNDKGLKHLAMVHHQVHVGHPAISSELMLGWMESPDVTAVARLVHHDPDRAAFVYATGTCFPLAEVVRVFAEEEEGAGVKAGLELCYLVGEALADASEGGVPQGVTSHGNLNPWTIALKPDGQPIVLGYGLPQVEILTWLEDARQVPREDSFRYAPPERLDGEEEDIASDLFALALVGLELMMGRPVYDGLLDDVRQQASRGEGMRRLYQWRDKLPANVREVLGRALKPDPDTRFRSGLDFVYAVHDLLGSIDVEGPSLVEVMGRVRAAVSRGKAPIMGGKTGSLTAEELAELAADLEDYDERSLPPPRKPRPEPEPEADDTDEAAEAPRFASRVGRSRNQPEPEPEPDPRSRVRDRLRSRRRPSEENQTVVDDSPRERLLRRLKDDRSDPAAGRRRLRRTVGEEPPTRRRRTRRGEERSESASQSVDIGDPLGFDANKSQIEFDDDETVVDDTSEIDESSEEDEPDPVFELDEIDDPPAPAAGDDGMQPVSVAPLPEPIKEEEEVATTVGPSGLRASGGAAALLERLRGSSGGRRERRSRRSRRSPDPAPEPVSEPPSPPEPEPEPAPEPPPPADPEPVVDVVSSPVPVPSPDPAPRPAPTAPPPTSAGDALTIRVRGPGDHHVDLPVATVDDAGAIALRGATALGLVVADATGALDGWWAPDVPAGTPASDLGEGALHLRRVEPAIRGRRVTVHGKELALLLSDAVPASWLAAHLARTLGLEGAYVLGCGARALAPFEVLEGLDPDGDALWLRPG